MVLFLSSAGIWIVVGTILIARTFSTRLSRKPRETCAYCGYSLRGDCSYRCPECGKSQPHPWYPVPVVDPATRRLFTGSTIALVFSIALIAVTSFDLRVRPIHALTPRLTLFIALWSTLVSFALVVKGTKHSRQNGSTVFWWPLTLAIMSMLTASGILAGLGLVRF